jgi:hypothetical protein
VPKGKPFPHLNNADSFQKMVRRYLAFALATLIVAVSLVGVA